MIRHLLLCLAACGLLFAPACSAPHPLPRSFVYVGHFEPSFLGGGTFVVRSQGSAGYLRWTRYHQREVTDTLRYAVYTDSVALTPQDLQGFFTALDSVPLLRMKTRESLVMDGIWVQNTVAQDGARNAFRFDSPTKADDPVEHRLVEAVLGLARRKFRALPEQEYWEQLEQYFDYGLPGHITRTHPWEARLYGNLSFTDVRQAELRRFLQRLPSDEPVLLDLTNFNGMGTAFYPQFQALVRRNRRLVWVPSPHAREQLLEMGVPPQNIVNTVAEGRARNRAAPW